MKKNLNNSSMIQYSQLKKTTYAGLKERGVEKTPEVANRIEYELEINFITSKT